MTRPFETTITGRCPHCQQIRPNDNSPFVKASRAIRKLKDSK